MENKVLYICGLLLVILYLLMGLDDFIWDLAALIRKTSSKVEKFDMSKVDSAPPKLLAVMIAAWKEDNVLGDVIDNFIESTIYPLSMYHIFLGVYSNDKETVRVAKALSNRYPNVHAVVNSLPGPTSKAQNINYVISSIKEFEAKRGWKFHAFTIHDSEDVVHPYEMKTTNYLLGKYKAVQFPVFPLIRMPKPRNYFKDITTSTYADEFAENHFFTMVNRNNFGAFVPSAGTGFTLSREVADSFEEDEVLPGNSLTEDYRLSLTLYERGIPMYYVLERVPRVNDRYKVVYDFVSTRSMFPKTFSAAVRQKTRWITGITMQSAGFKDVFKTKGMKFTGRYSLYKDQKAKIGNLIVFVGYPVLIYFLTSLFTELPPIYPKYTLSWYLCLLVTVMMLERQAFRAVSVYHIYGMRSVFYSCLFPPFLPFRIIWGNIINFTATVKSYRQKYLGVPKSKKTRKKNDENKGKVKWDKTDHAFLEKNVLKRYHRKIGDILIERKMLTPVQLIEALKEIDSMEEKESLGRYLLGRGIITEAQFLECLAKLTNRVFINTEDFREFRLLDKSSYSEEKFYRDKIFPVMKRQGETVVAVSEYSSKDVLGEILFREDITVCFACAGSIEKGLKRWFELEAGHEEEEPLIERLYRENKIDAQQALIARSIQAAKGADEAGVLCSMGLREKI